jgi:hypothetical protein
MLRRIRFKPLLVLNGAVDFPWLGGTALSFTIP